MSYKDEDLSNLLCLKSWLNPCSFATLEIVKRQAVYKTALNEKALFLNDEKNNLFLAFEIKENLSEVTFDFFEVMLVLVCALNCSSVALFLCITQ